MANSHDNVDTLSQWAQEDLSPEDKAALSALAAGSLGEEEYGAALRDPQVRKVVQEGGKVAMDEAARAAARLVGDRQDDHWTNNPDTKNSDQ